MLKRHSLLAILTAALATSAAADPLRVQLFSGVDREAVEIGGILQVNLEAVAVPQSRGAAAALAQAFQSWDVQGQLGSAFEVVHASEAMSRRTDAVVEHQRRVMVRVLEDVLEVPALRLEVGFGSRVWGYETRPAPLQTFDSWSDAQTGAASVVSITAEGTLDGIPFERIGSAFAVGGDALVTAYHVVVGARRVRVQMPDGREVRIGRVWALDPSRDIAILHLEASRATGAGLLPLVVAPHESESAVAFTAGWPGREQRHSVARRYPDLALEGHRLRVSGNAVQPGDSGGPLLDDRGRVLGVVVSGRGTGGARDLLAESICIASDLGPALAQYQSADRPERLSHALRRAADALPAARAHQAAGAIQIPVRRSDDDRRVHVSLLLEVLSEAPNDPILQYVAGTALETVGEDGFAASAFEAARRGGYVPASYSLAHHLLSEGDLEGAAALFAETAEGAYRHLGAFGRAQSLIELGRYDAAEADLLTVLDADARFAPALYLLGIVRLAQGRDLEAAALTVRLGSRPEWANALRLPIEAEALRPPYLRRLPRVAAR